MSDVGCTPIKFCSHHHSLLSDRRGLYTAWRVWKVNGSAGIERERERDDLPPEVKFFCYDGQKFEVKLSFL